MDQDELRSAVGKVKWFDPVKGYGFIQTVSEDNDILVHAQVLRSSGWQVLHQGASVGCEYAVTDKGLQATKILSVDPDTIGEGYSGEVSSGALMGDVDGFFTTCVKWYNAARGYGFLTSSIGSADIFLHADVVRRSGRDTMAVGELVEVRFSRRPQGLVALELREIKTTQLASEGVRSRAYASQGSTDKNSAPMVDFLKQPLSDRSRSEESIANKVANKVGTEEVIDDASQACYGTSRIRIDVKCDD